MSILTDPPPALPHVVLMLCQLAFGGLHGAYFLKLWYLCVPIDRFVAALCWAVL